MSKDSIAEALLVHLQKELDAMSEVAEETVYPAAKITIEFAGGDRDPIVFDDVEEFVLHMETVGGHKSGKIYSTDDFLNFAALAVNKAAMDRLGDRVRK